MAAKHDKTISPQEYDSQSRMRRVVENALVFFLIALEFCFLILKPDNVIKAVRYWLAAWEDALYTLVLQASFVEKS